MSICEIRRLSKRPSATSRRSALLFDLLWEVLGPVGLAGMGGALAVIVVEWVRWLAG